MKRSLFISVCVGLLSLGLSSFTSSENEVKTNVNATASNGMRLEQTCGNQDMSNSVYLSDGGSYLIVKIGETSSYRIDWTGTTSGWREYYPKGTTQVSIYADRFTISVPGDSSPNVQTYCFVIHRN